MIYHTVTSHISIFELTENTLAPDRDEGDRLTEAILDDYLPCLAGSSLRPAAGATGGVDGLIVATHGINL